MQLFLDIADWFHCAVDRARARDDLKGVKIVRVDHHFEHELVDGQSRIAEIQIPELRAKRRALEYHILYLERLRRSSTHHHTRLPRIKPRVYQLKELWMDSFAFSLASNRFFEALSKAPDTSEQYTNTLRPASPRLSPIARHQRKNIP